MGKIFRLGVWQRAVIAITGIWMLVAPLVGSTKQYVALTESSSISFQLCLNHSGGVSAPGVDFKRCTAAQDRDLKRYADMRWQFYVDALLACAVLAALFWIVVGLGYLTVLWVLAGRERVVPAE